MRRDSKIQPFNDDYESDRINDEEQNPANDNDNDNNDNNNDNSQQKPDDDNNISRRESVCSEFSVSLDDVDLDGDEDIADYPDPHDPEEIDDTYQTSINYDNIDDEEELEHRRRADFAMSNNKTLINNYVHDEPEDIDDRTEREEEETDQEEEESDDELDTHIHDHLPPQGPVPDLSQTANLCPNCNTLLAQVDQHIEERAYLKRDLSALAISLSEEQTLRAQLQVSKENLEQEIDDWINAMFDKVNQMVFDEANTHEELEMLNREFKGKLETSIKSSGTRQDRLRELKLLLVHLDTTKQRQTAPTPTSGLNRNSVIRRSLMSNSPVNSPRSSRIFGNFGHMSPSIFSTASVDEYMQKGRRVYIDGVVFEEFQDDDILKIDEIMEQGFTPAQMDQIQKLRRDGAQREAQIAQIATSINELAQMFKELSVLIVEQGSIIDRIDYNIDQTRSHVQKGLAEVKGAKGHQDKATNCSWICMALLFLAILVCIAILVAKLK